MCPHNLANADRGGPEVIYLPIPEVEVAGMDLAGATQKPVDTSFRPFGAAEHIQRCHSRMRNDARVVESRTLVDSIIRPAENLDGTIAGRYSHLRDCRCMAALIFSTSYSAHRSGSRAASATKQFKCSLATTLGALYPGRYLESNATARTRWSS
jgi:hypothetical protein